MIVVMSDERWRRVRVCGNTNFDFSVPVYLLKSFEYVISPQQCFCNKQVSSICVRLRAV